MSIEKMLRMLMEEYEKAEKERRIVKPMAYALYTTWKKVDEIEKPRNDDMISRRKAEEALCVHCRYMLKRAGAICCCERCSLIRVLEAVPAEEVRE